MPKRDWDSFPDWLRSETTVYWVSGKPGSGKSTLMKYLVARPETQQRLNEWLPGTLTISHFLFRLGSKLQHSLKGLLLSLVRQLIQNDDAMHDLTHQLIQSLALKSHDTDWSVSELETLLLDILHRRPQSMAIFIDGLDEVLRESDLTRLLRLLSSLEELANSTGKLKLCLSSRPEPLQLQKLGQNLYLQLERLNKADLRRYAEANILVPPDYRISLADPSWIGLDWYDNQNPPSPERLAAWLVEMLAEKADGIFLWLYLTVDTVSRALELDESIKDLKNRIDHMPRELSALFEDMWERINGDSKEQQVRRGAYIRLVFNIASSRYHWQSKLRAQELPFTQFHTMLATNSQLLNRLIEAEAPETIPVGDLFEACRYTTRDIPMRCAGLVHCVVAEGTSHVSLPRYGSEYDPLRRYLAPGPAYAFVHRSAQDFLRETETGQSILRINKSPAAETYLSFLKASLVHCRLFQSFDSTGFDLPYARSYCMRLDMQLSRIEAIGDMGGTDSSCLAMIQLCENLFNRGILLGDSGLPSHAIATRGIREHERDILVEADVMNVQDEDAFILEAAFESCGILTWKYILSCMEDHHLRSGTISQLLSYACTTKEFHNGASLGDRHVATQELLSKGAGTHAAVSSRQEAPLSYDEIWIKRRPLATLLTTAWTQGSLLDIVELVELVHLLVDHHADMEEQIYVNIRYQGTMASLREMTRYTDGTKVKYCTDAVSLILAFPAWAILSILLDSAPSESGDRAECSVLDTYGERDAYDQARLFAVTLCNHSEDVGHSFGPLAKSDIYLQHHLEEFAHDLEHFARLLVDAFQAADKKPTRLSQCLPIAFQVVLAQGVRSSVDQALQALRGRSGSHVCRIQEARAKLGIETPLEEFPWRHSAVGTWPFTNAEILHGRLDA